METLLYAGSFDPITRGHLDVIRRAAALCGRLVVAVMVNRQKRGTLPPETRAALVRQAVAPIGNVEVLVDDGLLVDCARRVGADAVVRGLRPVGDFESEYQMAQVNRVLGGAETLFLVTAPEVENISSSLVRELHSFGGDIAPFVPEGMEKVIAAALEQAAK